LAQQQEFQVDIKKVNYDEEKGLYYKVLLGLLLLTAITFVQPHYFLTGSIFLAQMLIAVVKAYLIIMFYMHLKGESLITWMGFFSLTLVVVFFVIVIGFDVPNFQYGSESYITDLSANDVHTTEDVHHNTH
jgi:caa(3)-type oxidase subunit IV